MKANALKAKAVYYGDTLTDLSTYLGISQSTLQSKMTGKSTFKQNEIDKIILKYKLTPEETHEIFFGKEEQ